MGEKKQKENKKKKTTMTLIGNKQKLLQWLSGSQWFYFMCCFFFLFANEMENESYIHGTTAPCTHIYSNKQKISFYSFCSAEKCSY